MIVINWSCWIYSATNMISIHNSQVKFYKLLVRFFCNQTVQIKRQIRIIENMLSNWISNLRDKIWFQYFKCLYRVWQKAVGVLWHFVQAKRTSSRWTIDKTIRMKRKPWSNGQDDQKQVSRCPPLCPWSCRMKIQRITMYETSRITMWNC